MIFIFRIKKNTE